MIPGQIQRDLAGLQFCLLQAEEIRMQRGKIIREALLHTRAQTVDIPRDKPHTYHPSFRFHVKLYQIMTTGARVNLLTFRNYLS